MQDVPRSRRPAAQAAAEYGSALRILARASPNWTPPVVLVSGLANQGLDEMWREIERHRAAFAASGELTRKRERQQIKWMWALLEERLLRRVIDHTTVRGALGEIEREVAFLNAHESDVIRAHPPGYQETDRLGPDDYSSFEVLSDERVVDLEVERDPPIFQAFDEVGFPRRAVEIERRAVETRHQDAELALVSRRR